MVDRLRKVAEAATPGPWTHVPPPMDGTIHQVRRDDSHRLIARMDDTGYTPESSWEQRGADATFVATFDPPTVLALLDVVEAAAEAERTYANRLAAESRGDTLDEVDFWPHLAAMERLRGVLRAALGRLGGDTP